MTFETWLKIAFIAYVAFLLFGAPCLAQKQANSTLAKWSREDAESNR